MKEDLEESVARSLESKRDMISFLPDLLVDLWALGSSPDIVVDLLKPLGLKPEKARALDLGCGKGAVCITLAKELGIRTVGVDACASFLDDAHLKALELDVVSLCDFIEADLRDFIRSASGFDVVILASLGAVLGQYDACVEQLRQTVHPGGYILVDDGFLKGTSPLKRPGYEHYFSHEQVLRQLTTHGDKLVKEVILSDEDTAKINDGYLQAITGRGRELARRRPELKKRLEWYIQNQREECEVIDQYLTSAIWLLQRIS